MTSKPSVDFAREKKLIETLEFRIAAADTSVKLQTILQTFLPPLLQKLDSESAENRLLTTKVCQYVRTRLNIDQTIQLPIDKLAKVFQESSSAVVKQFSFIFIQQGLPRLTDRESFELLPVLTRTFVTSKTNVKSDDLASILAVEFLLNQLRTYTPPQRHSEDDTKLRHEFGLDEVQSSIISQCLAAFLLYSPQSSQHISAAWRKSFEKYYRHRPSIVPNLAKLISTSIFDDKTRLVPAILLSVDVNPAAEATADKIFKQSNFDFESDEVTQALVDLYRTANARLRTKILALLTKSRKSAEQTTFLIDVVSENLDDAAATREASKLRSAVFSYLDWTLRSAYQSEGTLRTLLQSLRDFVERQGWPSVTQTTTPDLEDRSKAYEGIGSIGVKLWRSASSTDEETFLSLLTWLFSSYRGEVNSDVRHGIEQSLSSLMSVRLQDANVLKELKNLLLWNTLASVGDEDPVFHVATITSARYTAVRFVNRMLPLHDADARLINVLALGSERREVIEEGQRGLDPYWHSATARMVGTGDAKSLLLPSYQSFLERVFNQEEKSHREAEMTTTLPVMEGLSSFSLKLLAAEAWRGTDNDMEVDTPNQSDVSVICNNSIVARKLLRCQLQANSMQLTSQLLCVCLRGAARGSSNCARIAYLLCSLSSNDTLRSLSAEIRQDLVASIKGKQTQVTAAAIAGVVGSLEPHWPGYILLQGPLLEQWRDFSGQNLITLEGELQARAMIISRQALRGHTQPTDVVHDVWKTSFQIIIHSTDESLKAVAYTVVSQLSLCSELASVADVDFEKLLEATFMDAKKEKESAVIALGRVILLCWDQWDQTTRDELIERIVALHEIRKAEFQFRLGETLVVAALGFKSTSTVTDFDVDAEVPPDRRHDTLFTELMETVLHKSNTTKPALKLASAIWLLCLLEYCSVTKLVEPHLRDCQVAFGKLLGDRDEIVQETASRGLSIVYEKGSKTLREDLVRDLLQSFTDSKAKTSGTVTQETQLFEPGVLPTENGQSVTTYKDIVSLAQEMGDPSLVYRFMNLASNNAIWTSRAAVGRFGLSGVLADSTFLQENKKLYPKLFRYRFDPNSNVRRSMNDIWKALVKDTNSVVEQNFDLIMTDLLRSILSGREWRTREASCAAIADLVQGRDIAIYEQYLDDIWKVAFKVLDDVKETVRKAAHMLCRTLTNLLIENMNIDGGTTKRATIMLSHAIPLLLQQMSNGSAKDVQQYAIVSLLRITEKAPPKALLKFAPTILETLVTSLSSFEHESVNYLHLNADKYGLTTEKLDEMRVSSVGRSPVYEAIEKCLQSLAAEEPSLVNTNDNRRRFPVIDDAMKRLESCFKITIGLPSRVGLSKVLISLATNYHSIFRPYADRFARATRRSVLDMNPTISQAFSTALARLLRLASEKEVQQTINYAQKIYFESQELMHRMVAGEIVLAISKCSNDVFNSFAPALLPFSFIGCQDLDKDTRERFVAAWTDNVGGSRALHLYLREISTIIHNNITSNLWPIKHACSLAVANLVATMDAGQQYAKADAELMWSLVEAALSGKTWEGKEKIITIFPTFVRRARALWSEKGRQMTKIAFREANRSNEAYRPHAIQALGEFAEIRDDIDITDEAITLISEVIDESVNPDAMELDEKSGMESSLKDNILSSSIACLFASLRTTSSSRALDQALDIVRRVSKYSSRSAQKATYSGAAKYFEQFDVALVKTDVKNEIDLTSPSNHSEARRFSHGLILALSDADPSKIAAYASDPESLRQLRVEMILNLLKSSIAEPKTRELSREVLDALLKQERSRELRNKIQMAIQLAQ